MSALFWKKGEKRNLSKHFNTIEFQCKCSYPECIDQMVEQELIDKLEKIREEVKMPIKISSGFRCTPYQKHLRDTKASTVVAFKSQHELGAACDASCGMPYDEYLKICEKYFKSIGLGKTFLHLDLRSDKPKRRWNY